MNWLQQHRQREERKGKNCPHTHAPTTGSIEQFVDEVATDVEMSLFYSSLLFFFLCLLFALLSVEHITDGLMVVPPPRVLPHFRFICTRVVNNHFYCRNLFIYY